MNQPNLSAVQGEVISANVQLYRQVAGKYDEYEVCVQDRRLQAMLRADVSRIAGLVSASSGSIKCLDCGGGSGNLSLKMLEMGWDVTVVDVSPDMLNLLKEKAGARGFVPKLINSSIEEYFCSSSEVFHVISFSSVLHHLYSYLAAVEQATDHIRDGGVFYSSFDPVASKHPSLRSIFEAFDTACAKAVHDRSDFFPGIGRRMEKLFRPSDKTHQRPVPSPGDLAEYHAKKGIEEREVIKLLETKGFCVVEHFRCPIARTWLARLLNDRLRLMESCKVMARRSIQV